MRIFESLLCTLCTQIIHFTGGLQLQYDVNCSDSDADWSASSLIVPVWLCQNIVKIRFYRNIAFDFLHCVGGDTHQILKATTRQFYDWSNRFANIIGFASKWWFCVVTVSVFSLSSFDKFRFALFIFSFNRLNSKRLLKNFVSTNTQAHHSHVRIVRSDKKKKYRPSQQQWRNSTITHRPPRAPISHD